MQRVSIVKISKVVEFLIMEYQHAASQYCYNYPEVRLENTSYDFNSYFASFMNSHVHVASRIGNENVASANVYSIIGSHHASYNSDYYMQKPMSKYALSFSNTSNKFRICDSTTRHANE